MQLDLFVSGCKTSGVYGDGCEKQCPTNCKDNVCHMQMGTCFGCGPGWNGTTCNTSMIENTFYFYVSISNFPVISFLMFWSVLTRVQFRVYFFIDTKFLEYMIFFRTWLCIMRNILFAGENSHVFLSSRKLNRANVFSLFIS